MNTLPGVSVKRTGKIEELKQQDYNGKRVYVEISDDSGFKIKSKIDFGVHNKLDIHSRKSLLVGDSNLEPPG